MSKLILGCIADDFTGASDAASFIVAGGMNTIQTNGIPGPDFELPESCEAVVISLKSRTQETGAAVRDSLAAIRWLEEHGAGQFYVKYCSTFDSTPSGNIGPILDAVLEYTGARSSILCPSLPANGRSVKDGILYVNGVPLAESHMKDHPLTPMWESRIAELMRPQSKYPSVELHSDVIRGSRETALQKVRDFAPESAHTYIIPDYCEDSDAEILAELFGDMKVLSGGSGILTALARKIKGGKAASAVYTGTKGPAVILGGSCSVATNAQTAYYMNHGGHGIRLNDADLLSGAQNPETLWEEAKAYNAPLIYSYETPEGLKAKRNEAGKALSALIEKTLSGTAALAVRDGARRIIVAGGETSGAVTQALGYQAFWIGDSIAPGVPVLTPVEQPEIRLVLKSGNFGQEDFFTRALAFTGSEE